MTTYPRSSSRLRKGSGEQFQGSLSPIEKPLHHKRNKRQKRSRRKTQDDESGADTDEERDCDILSTIEKEEGWYSGEADEDVDLPDDDCESISSGPSALHGSSPKRQEPSHGLCSTCWSLYKKAKKMKAPIKNKQLDNDPKSLTCDQWVLLKQWRPRRVPHTRGKLLTHLRLVKKRLVRQDVKTTNGLLRVQEGPVCLRKHIFLQRNLKKVLVKPRRKRNKRKRPRDDALCPRAAKQQRLHSSDHAQHTSNNRPVVKTNNCGLYERSTLNLSSGSDGWSVQESDGPEDVHHAAELTSSSVNVNGPSKPQKVTVKPNAANNTAGFRDLLAQMRGNTNVIISEKF